LSHDLESVSRQKKTENSQTATSCWGTGDGGPKGEKAKTNQINVARQKWPRNYAIRSRKDEKTPCGNGRGVDVAVSGWKRQKKDTITLLTGSEMGQWENETGPKMGKSTQRSEEEFREGNTLPHAFVKN